MQITKKIKTKKLEFEYVVKVTKDGLFTTILPENIIVKLESVGIKVGTSPKHRIKGYFSESSLNELTEKVSSIVDKYSETKIVEKKIVLKYSINTRCSYCKLKTGEIVPNGSWQKEIEDDYNWISGNVQHDTLNCSPYGVEIYVAPTMRITWEYPDKTQYKEYDRIPEGDRKEGSTLSWLCDVVAMGSEDNVENVKEIDYTEEIGLFFKNSLISICEMNEKLKKIFGDNIKIKSKMLLENKNRNLLETK